MTLDTFFKKFDQFADAPDAVAKMRELVLQLAVQGKLVEQKHGDGNAKGIFTDRLPEKGETRYEIPATWMWIRFASVGEQRLGKMLDQRGNRGDLKPYLRNTNVQWMRFELDDIKELRLAPEELEEFRLQPGDLLICEGGEPGRCAIWRDPHQEMYFQKAIHRVRPRKGILSDYLAICLQVDAQNGVLAKQFTGATIKHFTGRSLREYSIPLPPLAEQKRIVAKVDELMALCDRLEALQQQRDEQASALARASLARFAEAPTPANLNLLFHKSYSISPADLRKAVLTLAVRGKLLRQDAKDESASVLLTRITQQRPVNSINSAEKPFEVPDNWHWVRLGDLVESMSNGIYKPAKFYNEAGTACVRMYNIQDGKLDLAKLKRLDLAQNEVDQYRLEVGDLLVNRVNSRELVGKCGIVEANDEPLVYEAMNIRIRLVERNNLPSYVNLVLRTDRVRDIFQNSSKQAIGQASINQPQVASVAIPLPPLAEQCRIVAKVDQLMALVDQLESQLAASRATAKSLLEALVGELTNVNRS